MFARGVVYLHAACPERSAFLAPRVLHRGQRAHLPVPKSLSAKSSVSVSSKLIEIKGLQLHYFGHLRKTGGRGSYRLVHTAYLPLQKPHGTKSNYSRTYEPLSRKSNYSRTYAIPQGWWVPLAKTPFCVLPFTGHPRKNVGAPTFLIFPLIFRTFLALSAVRRVARQLPAAAPSAPVKHTGRKNRATLRAGGGRCTTQESWHKSLRYMKPGRAASHQSRISSHLICYSMNRRLSRP
jgi:hypothetical protein